MKYIKVEHAEKACFYCGINYMPKRSNSMYCSDRCKNNASKIKRGIAPVEEVIKICESCGCEFKTVYKRKKYCSRRCGDKGHYIPKPPKEKSPKPPKPPIKTEKRKCCVCGTEYECNEKSSNKTCSHICSVELKKERRRQHHRNREKRIKDVLIDKDINLITLARRDNNICWICGKQCDFLDRRVINETIIVGTTYPSIDHVLPLSRGGKHEWENIKLAHMKCNSLRGATLSDRVDDMTREEARRYARQICTNKKEVIQYVNGIEYARYESAAQASRITGFKEKGIQNACRGEGSNRNKINKFGHRMYGYEWKYAG